MVLEISEQTQRLLSEALDSGQYASIDELLAAAVTALRQEEAEKLEALRAAIRVGLEQSARGDSSPMDFRALQNELDALEVKKS